jgi:hypothetical protein
MNNKDDLFFATDALIDAEIERAADQLREMLTRRKVLMTKSDGEEARLNLEEQEELRACDRQFYALCAWIIELYEINPGTGLRPLDGEPEKPA